MPLSRADVRAAHPRCNYRAAARVPRQGLWRRTSRLKSRRIYCLRCLSEFHATVLRLSHGVFFAIACAALREARGRHSGSFAIGQPAAKRVECENGGKPMISTQVPPSRRGGRAADCTGLENRRRRKAFVSSNLTPSAYGYSVPLTRARLWLPFEQSRLVLGLLRSRRCGFRRPRIARFLSRPGWYASRSIANGWDATECRQREWSQTRRSRRVPRRHREKQRATSGCGSFF